jgi:hypothetical protein
MPDSRFWVGRSAARLRMSACRYPFLMMKVVGEGVAIEDWPRTPSQ